MSDERLSRMEDKLDKLSEAVVEMARMEERLLTIFKRLEHMDAALLQSLNVSNTWMRPLKSMMTVWMRLKSKLLYEDRK